MLHILISIIWLFKGMSLLCPVLWNTWTYLGVKGYNAFNLLSDGSGEIVCMRVCVCIHMWMYAYRERKKEKIIKHKTKYDNC